MIHQPLGGAQGQASDIEITAREILILKEELYKIENKIKLRQEFYHSKILETSTKAKTKFEAYDKYHLISEQEAMQKNLHVL